MSIDEDWPEPDDGKKSSSSNMASSETKRHPPGPLFCLKRTRGSYWNFIRLIAPPNSPIEEMPSWESKDAIGAWCLRCEVEISYSKGNINSVKSHLSSRHPDHMGKLKVENNDETPAKKIKREKSTAQKYLTFMDENGDDHAAEEKNGETSEKNGDEAMDESLDDSIKQRYIKESRNRRRNSLSTKEAVDMAKRELLQLNKLLLDSIVSFDWTTYAGLCHDSITCFEPEAKGALVEGLDFHKYYFDRKQGNGQEGEEEKKQETSVNVTMASPHVRILGGGNAAVVSYVRLTQFIGDDGKAETSRLEETRVWERTGGTWRQVHFHR